MCIGFDVSTCTLSGTFLLLEFVDILTKVSTVVSVTWQLGTYVFFTSVDTTTDDLTNGKAKLAVGQYTMNIYNENSYMTSGFTNKIYTENVYVL